MLGHWNHRVLRKKESDGNYYFQIHEVYYDENGKAWAATETPARPLGESQEELKETVQLMLNACDFPILDYDDIPEEGAIDPCDD